MTMSYQPTEQTADTDTLYPTAAEESLLGCALYGRESADEVFSLIQMADIASERVRGYLDTIRTLLDGSGPIDAVSVAMAYPSTAFGEAATYLGKCADMVPSAANAGYYASQAREAAQRRRIKMAAANAMIGAADQSVQPAELLARFEAEVDSVADTRVEVMDGRTLGMIAYENLKKRVENKGKLSGIPSMFPAIDQMTDGWQKKELVIIGARPSIGKTVFGVQCFGTAALTHNIPSLFVSLEMPAEAISNRMIAAFASIPLRHITRGETTEGEMRKMTAFAAKMKASPINLVEIPGGTHVSVVATAIRRAVRRHGIQLVVVDYVQQMTGSGENRAAQVKNVTTKLKAIAKSCNVAVIALAQLNRKTEEGDKPRKPKLSDLKESGGIEEDADVVLMLHRDRKEPIGPAEIIAGKVRNGELDDIQCRYNGPFVRFEDTRAEIGPED